MNRDQLDALIDGLFPNAMSNKRRYEHERLRDAGARMLRDAILAVVPPEPRPANWLSEKLTDFLNDVEFTVPASPIGSDGPLYVVESSDVQHFVQSLAVVPEPPAPDEKSLFARVWGLAQVARSYNAVYDLANDLDAILEEFRAAAPEPPTPESEN